MLAVIFLTRTSMGFQFQSIASVAPFLVDDLRLTYAQLGLLMGLYLLPGAVISLPGGVLGQRFGSRRVALWGLGLMAGGGLVTAQSPGFALACAGRIVSGVGGILLNLLLAKMVSDWFRGKEIATAMGVMLSAWPFGIALALLSLGPLGAAASWRASVQVTVAAALAALALLAWCYRDPPDLPSGADGGRLDLRLPARVWALACIAGLGWSLLNAGFIAVVQVVVYIGAIAILFIFAVMVTRKDLRDTGPQLNKGWWMGAVVSLAAFAGLWSLLRGWSGLANTPVELPPGFDAVGLLGEKLVSPDAYVLPFEVASVLLLAAMVGAVYVAFNRK